MALEERCFTFRAKIEHLNYIKWGVKYIWGQFPLSEESNELIVEPKWASFSGLTCRYRESTGHE